jgi:hypothetical protein
LRDEKTWGRFRSESGGIRCEICRRDDICRVGVGHIRAILSTWEFGLRFQILFDAGKTGRSMGSHGPFRDLFKSEDV